MTDKQRNISMTIMGIVLFPFTIVYKCSNKSIRLLVDKDLSVMDKKQKVHFNHKIASLMYHLLKNKYYRNIFYSRLGRVSLLCKWLLPQSKMFINAATFGGGIYPAHPFATIINAKSVGENFVVRQCTTIGNKKDGASDERPTIGDNVNLGSNVVIIGNINIGDNVTVGAGTVITKDVPSNCTVVGNPFRIIKKK